MSGTTAPPPRIGVLAVQGAVSEHEAALADVGARTRRVRAPGDLDGLDGLVIPGGESTTFGLVAGESGLLPAVRGRIDAGMPVLGTCAGMIMLADGIAGGGPQPLVGGMDIVVRRNARVGAPPMRGIFIRAPWIEAAGPSIEVLAEHGGHPVAARDATRIVAAFHPELTGDRRLHRMFVERVRASAGALHKEGSVVGAQ